MSGIEIESVVGQEWPKDRDIYESAFSWLDENKVEMASPEDVKHEFFQKNRVFVFENNESSSNEDFASPKQNEERSFTFKPVQNSKFKSRLSIKIPHKHSSYRAIQFKIEEVNVDLSQIHAGSEEQVGAQRDSVSPSNSESFISTSPDDNSLNK